MHEEEQYVALLSQVYRRILDYAVQTALDAGHCAGQPHSSRPT